MAIKGLTNARMDTTPRGRAVVIGSLHKGTRTGFGKNAKMTDEDYFIFSPYADGEKGDRMSQVFWQTYGREPQELDGVHIAQDIAGNFDIENCAWLVASKHTKNGSIFLARSDGEKVYSIRSEKSGRVLHLDGEDEPHDKYSKPNKDDIDCFVYKGNLYPWQHTFKADLILPAFNVALNEAGISGYGVVTLKTSSINDIATLVSQYHATLNEVASLWAAYESRDFEIIRNHIPLRAIPLRLYRDYRPITIANYHKKDKGERVVVKKSLLNWQLSPEFSLSMHRALQQRTQLAIAAAASSLQPSQPAMIPAVATMSNDELLGDLFGDAPSQPETTREVDAVEDGVYDEVISGLFDNDEVVTDIEPEEVTEVEPEDTEQTELEMPQDEERPFKRGDTVLVNGSKDQVWMELGEIRWEEGKAMMRVVNDDDVSEWLNLNLSRIVELPTVPEPEQRPLFPDEPKQGNGYEEVS